MQIKNIRTIAGPNVISHNPVLVMRLDLEDLTGAESYDVPGFIDRLIAALPGARERYEGASFVRIVERVCLELADRAGIPVNRGKTISAGRLYDVCVEYKSEAGMRRLLQIGFELVRALVDDRPYALEERVVEVLDVVRNSDPDPGARAIVDAAARRGIPAVRLGDDNLVQLGYGCHRKFIQGAMSSDTSAIAVGAAGDKSVTKALLTRAGVPVPGGRVVDSLEAAERAFEELGASLVVKPLDGNQGKGASLDLCTSEQVCYAFEIARQISKRVVVEELLRGRDYRVLVVGGRMLAACERLPARVVGDGRRAVQELIDEANRDPRRGEERSQPMSAIKVDRVLLASLTKQGYTLDSVPAEGAAVVLRENADLSTGGAAIDVTDRVHPSMRMICERAARAIGLDIAGVNLVVPDISRPFTTGGVVEVNAAPGIRMHLFPSEGAPRDVATEIVRQMFPDGNGRVPIVSITGAGGRTTVTRLTAHILAQGNPRVGIAAADGIWIGSRQVARGDAAGPRSAATVLFDPEVEIAVLETACGGIARDGLGYDWSDVGVMTGIQPARDDILRIESLVAERAREGGTLVLNADDPLLRTVPDRPNVSRIAKNIVWFSPDLGNSAVENAQKEGKTVYFCEDGFIIEASGTTRRRIMDVASIPMTSGGAPRFQVANVMASVAACRALGVGVAQIRAALRSFDAAEHDPARANLYAVGGGYVLFDYGHNSAAFDAIWDAAKAWSSSDRVCVLGVPGDRGDDLIREFGRAAASGFDRIIVREDKDLRGRQPGEIPRLLIEGIQAERSGVTIDIVPDELEALGRALDTVGEGGLVAVFCDACDEVREYLKSRGATPATSIALAREQAGVV